LQFLVVILLAAISIAMADETPHGAILPSGEMKAQNHLTAENRPTIRLNPAKVPSDLRDLIPVAEKWGIADDIIRNDFVMKASPKEKAALSAALKGRNKRITQWLASLPRKQAMSLEAATFMYMQEGLDEMGVWVE
jgi:hypothetical protein